MSQTWDLLDKLRPKKRRITGRTDADGRPPKTRKHSDGARSLFDSDGNVSSVNILVPDRGPGRSTRNAVKEHERQQRLGIIPRTTIKRRDLGPRSRKSGNAEYLKFRESFVRDAERELAKLLSEHEFTTNEFNCLESTQGVLDFRPNKNNNVGGGSTAGISSADPSFSSSTKPWMSTGAGAQKYFAQFRTVREYLQSHTCVGDGEEAPDEAQRIMEKELELRKRIKAVADRGAFSLHTHAESYQSLPGERKRIKDTDDDILVQYPRLYKLKMNAAKGRVNVARKCAKAVDKYWSIQRSQSEKQAKIEARRLARLAKQTAQLVMNKWKVIERVCKAREGELAQEQLSRKAQRHLQEILEHSEQMLGARMEELSRRRFASEDRETSATPSPRSRSTSVKIDEIHELQPANGSTPGAMSTPADAVEAETDDSSQVAIGVDDDKVFVNGVSREEPIDQDDQHMKDTSEAPQEDGTTLPLNTADLKPESENIANDVEMVDATNADENEAPEDLDMHIAEEDNEMQAEKDEDLQSADETTETEYGTDVSDVEFDEHVAIESRQEKQSTPETTMKAVETIDGLPSEKEAAAEKEDTNKAPTTGITQQPTGTTLSTTNVNIQIPFLLRGTLREYQHVGLDWLASLYNNGLNGILADEMGLGKTIQTISLLAYLACEKGVWGPHLIVVPTSVILNWEMEFKRWLPGFKILTYYGNPKERKEKRQGWSKPNAFHVCITSYQLVLQDQQVFRRRPWHYLILDEAHHIKNFRSQRWQVLLNFNSSRRLLLTGTPLQNNLMELWSLLYFLMPNGVSASMPVGFANQKEFQEWFSHPVDRMIESQQGMDEESRAAIQKLHTVLRPYLLRRLKADVEKQLPAKHEHIVYCRLSKRQRFLYDDFMSRAKTKDTLASGNFLSIINCLMQLRKVCNHPDLFEERPITTSFAMDDSVQATGRHIETFVRKRLSIPDDYETLQSLNLVVTGNEELSATISQSYDMLNAAKFFLGEIAKHRSVVAKAGVRGINSTKYRDLLKHAWSECSNLTKYRNLHKLVQSAAAIERWESMHRINSFRCARRSIYGSWLIQHCQNATSSLYQQFFPNHHDNRTYMHRSDYLRAAVLSYEDRIEKNLDIIERYGFVTPGVVTRHIAADQHSLVPVDLPPTLQVQLHKVLKHDIFHPIRSRLSIAFPDKRLLQYDCGKLQKLDVLLRQLAAGGHRALIFTQMTRVLDVLEAFLNIHGHRYLRLDGATKIEQRQALTEQFNNDKRILAFILSTRSGGLGINLTGADTVIFYDSDWNPSMDKQCQDRTHRIGQTRDVHIYRFVTEYTIEENIFKKANQKRMLDNVVIQEGEFTNDYFHKADWWRDLPEVTGSSTSVAAPPVMDIEQALLEAEGDENDARAAITARNEMDMDKREFDETQQRQSVSLSSQSPGPCSGSKETPLVPPSSEANSPFEDAAAASASAVVDDKMYEAEDEEVEDPAMNLTVGHVDQYMLRFWEREVVGTYLGFGGLAAPAAAADEYTP